MSLFDCLISRTNNSQLKTTIYKKKTHTDRNWNFYSNQYKSEHNKTSDYMTQTMQLNDFPKKYIKKAISGTLRYQQNTRKVIENKEGSIKSYLPYER